MVVGGAAAGAVPAEAALRTSATTSRAHPRAGARSGRWRSRMEESYAARASPRSADAHAREPPLADFEQVGLGARGEGTCGRILAAHRLAVERHRPLRDEPARVVVARREPGRDDDLVERCA